MKKIGFFILLIMTLGICNAQVLYQRAFYGMSLFFTKGSVTSDGGFVMIGQKYTTSTNQDIFLIKLDQNGDTLWTRTYLFPNNNDYAGDVLQTKDGGFFIVGWKYVLKTDSIGFPMWAKSMNSTGRSIMETPNGELIIGGTTLTSSVWNDGGVQLTKLDSLGNLIFSKVIGPMDNPFPNAIKNTNDGGYIIAGETGAGSSTNDAFMMKTDSAGNVLWARAYGTNGIDWFWSVEQTSSGDYLAIGGTVNPQETFLIKVDSGGSLIWSRVYQSGNSYSTGYMITRSSDQNFLFCGRIASPNHLSILGKMDEDGTVLWTKAYHPGINSNGSRFYGVYEAPDGNLIATGFYIEIPWNGYNNVVKFNSEGNSNCFTSDVSWTSTTFLSKDSALIFSNYNTNVFNTTVQSECFCDSTHFICTNVVGINEPNTTIASLNVYPNPFVEQLNIQSNVSELSEFILYDIQSRILLQKVFKNSILLNTNQLAKGIYLYEVRNKNGGFKRGKVVKE